VPSKIRKISAGPGILGNPKAHTLRKLHGVIALALPMGGENGKGVLLEMK